MARTRTSSSGREATRATIASHERDLGRLDALGARTSRPLVADLPQALRTAAISSHRRLAVVVVPTLAELADLGEAAARELTAVLDARGPDAGRPWGSDRARRRAHRGSSKAPRWRLERSSSASPRSPASRSSSSTRWSSASSSTPTRKIFSIGYRVTDGSLDPSAYDLLASEARLASFIAIAKGDVPVVALVPPRAAR